MKKVLMITYSYPPHGKGIRVLKFTQYLSEFGWKPYVISAKKNVYSSSRENVPKNAVAKYTSSLSMLEDLFENFAKRVNHYLTGKLYLGNTKQSFKAKLIKSLKTATTFFTPDLYIGWIPFALKSAKRIILEEGIDVIYATSPPPAADIIGALLKKITKKPLIIDFRDAWTFNPNLAYVTRLNSFLESFVLKNADHVIANTQLMKERYIAKYPYLTEKISLIRNGFDIEDLPKGEVRPFENFTITYTGIFGGTRSPDLFLKAVKDILAKNSIPKNKIRIKFIGSDSAYVEEISKTYGIHDIIDCMPHMPSKEAIEYIFRSNLLLLIEFTNSFPTKLFEYLASGRPILAILSKGELEDFIKEYSDNSYIITSVSIEEISNTIIDCYNKWENNIGFSYTINEKIKKFREEFNRRSLTEKLSEVFEGLSKNDNTHQASSS